MNTLTIPPSPNWFEVKIAVCSPDNTLIYGANTSLVIIKPAPLDKPADITVISFAHLDRVTGLALSPTWNATHQMVASIGDDRHVKVWNMLDNTCAYSHKQHLAGKNRPIGVAFINDTKLISVSEDGFVVIWQMTTNEFKPHKNFLPVKARVSALSTCPHAGWLAAFGLKSGLVVVADLRGNGNVLYKLRGHERDVQDFAWCPTPTNVIPDIIPDEDRKPVKEKSSDSSVDESNGKEATTTEIENGGEADAEDARDTIDAMPANGTHLQCALEQGQLEEGQGDAPCCSTAIIGKEAKKSAETTEKQEADKALKKKNIWVGLKHADDDEVPQDEPRATKEVLDVSVDFLGECLALKAKITEAIEEGPLEDAPIEEGEASGEDKEDRKILQASRAKKSKPEAEKSEEVAGVPLNTTCDMTPTPGIPPIYTILSGICFADRTMEVTRVQVEMQQVENFDIETEVPELEEEFLLASASRGGHICIWRAGTDGRVQRKMKLPKPKRSRFTNMRAIQNLYTTINWVLPETLLSSGEHGDLNSWNVVDQKPVPKLVTSDHPKHLFCIAAPRILQPAEQNSSAPGEVDDAFGVWSMGHDRNILFTTLKNREVVAAYPTFSCSILAITASPITPTRLALGLSDGFIRLWDLSKPHLQYIDMAEIKNRLSSKVMALAWHTSDEFVLAFGTEEGQVGHMHTGQCGKAPVYFAHYYLSAIHKLEWAPVPNHTKHGLYVCSDGTIGVYDFDKVASPPTILPTPKTERVTNFSWKADFAKLAVGCKSGTIYILDAQYQVVNTLYYQKKGVTCMSWHPLQTAQDEEISPNQDWLACATGSDNSVVIYDTKAKLTSETSETENKESVGIKESLVSDLQGHIKPVNQIVWSPYKNGQLCTVSEDGTAIVWNELKPVSTYVNNTAEPLLAGLWSPLSENMIITAGRDCAVRIWNYLEHPSKDQDDVERVNRKKILAHYRQLKEVKDVKMGQDQRSRRIPILSEISGRQGQLEMALRDCREMFEYFKDYPAKPELGSHNNVVKLFAEPAAIVDVLEEQRQIHEDRSYAKMRNHLDLWRGDMGEAIKKSITEGTLNPWLISIAPMISYKLWQEAVQAYCVQLTEAAVNWDPIEIASYYLSLHKIDEAIDILKTKQLYREALALAKYKKPEDTDLHAEILDLWTKANVVAGRFELAAQSYISVGNFEQAAKMLYKRADLPSLALAVEIAHHSGNKELTDTIKFRRELLQIEASGSKAALPLKTRLEIAMHQNRGRDKLPEERAEHIKKMEIVEEIKEVKKAEEIKEVKKAEETKEVEKAEEIIEEENGDELVDKEIDNTKTVDTETEILDKEID